MDSKSRNDNFAYLPTSDSLILRHKNARFTASNPRLTQANLRVGSDTTSIIGGFMIRPKRTVQLLTVAAAATLVVSACGGSNDNNGGSSQTTSTDETSATGPTPSGDGTLVIGTLLP